jgi:hypothetical protein
MPAQPLSTSHHDNTFPMLKEHLTNVIDELVNVSNRCKINSLIDKFDTEATKAHHLMQQAQEDMITAQTYCFNAIRDVLPVMTMVMWLAMTKTRVSGMMQRCRWSTTTCNNKAKQNGGPPAT